jgi:Family of unknown function (DUF5947)
LLPVTRLTALERFVRRSSGYEPAADAACELCAAPLDERHRHVLELAPRALRCACGACAVLFDDPHSGGGRWRTIPNRVLVDPGWSPTVATLSSLRLPVQLTAVYFDSPRRRHFALHPSPGGAVESELDEGQWRSLAAESPLAARLTDDVEALLFRGRRGAAVLRCWLAPIDACYELAGVMRLHWRGFDGGDEARAAIDEFFARLEARAEAISAGAGKGRE